jgi:hypothetical protein
MTAPATYNAAQPAARSSYPALRVNNTADSLDTMRVQLVQDRWNAQNDVRLPFERQVEEHCRLLAGRQWDVWSDTLGRFIDVTALFSEEEKLFRQRPVVNYLAYWYLLTHARLTENPPILTFQPATADRSDAMLAETLDTIFKTCWADAHMSEAMDRLMAWVVASGSGFVKSYPDLTKGQESPRVGPASVTLEHPETGEPTEYDLDQDVPYSAEGEPQFEIHQDEQGDLHAVPTAEVEYEKDGAVCVAVLNPVQVRGEWNSRPWHEKAWHIHRDYYTVADVERIWKIAATADTQSGMPDMGSGNQPGYLERLLFGGGYFGATERGGNGMLAGGNAGLASNSAIDKGFVRVDEYWEKASPENNWQGRHLVVTGTMVLHDGPNPFPKLKGPSPIRCFQFVGMPGRPAGTTPLEFLVPLQRQMNRGWAQAMEHQALMTNPAILADDSAGLDDEQFTMIPGMIVHGGMRDGKPMVGAFQPPTLSVDFWKTQEMVRDTLMFLGNISGTEGDAPTDSASGELVSQLRANSDRFIGPTARQMVTELARMADDWTAILSVIWTRPKLILTAGEDNVAQTVAVEPELWSGNANAVPDVGSMLPESRQAKQQRLMAAFTGGLFGNPADPSVAEKVRPLFNFPDLGRAMQPGGVDASTAQQALGKVLLGQPAASIEFFEPYKMPIWLDIIGAHIASPEFLRNSPEVRAEVLQLFEKAQMFAMQQAVQQAAKQAGVQHASLQAAAANDPMVAAQANGAMQSHLSGGVKPGAASKAASNGPPHAGPATPADLSPAHNAPPPPPA